MRMLGVAAARPARGYRRPRKHRLRCPDRCLFRRRPRWPGQSGEAVGLPGWSCHTRHDARRWRLWGGRVDTRKCGFGVLSERRGRLRGQRVDTRNRGFGGWSVRRGRLRGPRVDTRKCGFGVLSGRRGRFRGQRVDTRNRGFGGLCGCCGALVGQIDPLAQFDLGRDENSLPQRGAEADWRHDFTVWAWGDPVGRDGHWGRLRLNSVD